MENVLIKFERVIRRANNSTTIALPPEALQVLNITGDTEKVNIYILKDGSVKLEKGEQK